MKLRLRDESRVSVTVRSKGVLGALEHELSFDAPLRGLVLPDVDDATADGVAVEASVRADALSAPATASAFDRRQMLDNLRGKDVLDVARWPVLAFRGSYRGSLGGGRLSGELLVRGSPRPIAWDIAVVVEASRVRARGEWRGTLTDLGVKPFKAMLGALRLHDEAQIALDVSFDREDV